MHIRRSIHLATVCLLFASRSEPALAETKLSLAEARLVAKEGLIALDHGLNEEAVNKLTRAYEVVKVPTLGLYTARALASVGRLVEAFAVYVEATHLEAAGTNPTKQRQAKQAADRELALLAARIPQLTIRQLQPAKEPAELFLDSKYVSPPWNDVVQAVNPGYHLIELKSPTAKVSQEVTLREGERSVVELSLSSQGETPSPAVQRASWPNADTTTKVRPQTRAAVPTTTPNMTSDTWEMRQPSTFPRQTLIWVGIGAAGAGLVIGGTLVAIARSRRASLDENGCAAGHCYSDQASRVDTYNALLAASTISFSVGAAALTGSLVLLATRHAGKSTRQTVDLVLHRNRVELVSEF